MVRSVNGAKMDSGAMSISDWCQWSGIGKTKTYELIGDGFLPVVKLGNKTLIRRSDGEALLERFLQKSPIASSKGADGK